MSSGRKAAATEEIAGPVVEWILRESPELKIQVRFLSGPHDTKFIPCKSLICRGFLFNKGDVSLTFGLTFKLLISVFISLSCFQGWVKIFLKKINF